MHVRITNLSETATSAVSILRPDLPPGEPSSLAHELTLQPGESASFDLPNAAVVALSTPGSPRPANHRLGNYEPPSQEYWP
ncbi:MAG TPA: hypothetical protein VHN11_01560 [Xanthobacteraceae bacterium]|jgi:hypothetical protein|nr:hypothetical protein [Xanthobacteraceae bacterium]